MAQAMVDVRIAVGPEVDEPRAAQRTIYRDARIRHQAHLSYRVFVEDLADPSTTETPPPSKRNNHDATVGTRDGLIRLRSFQPIECDHGRQLQRTQRLLHRGPDGLPREAIIPVPQPDAEAADVVPRRVGTEHGGVVPEPARGGADREQRILDGEDRLVVVVKSVRVKAANKAFTARDVLQDVFERGPRIPTGHAVSPPRRARQPAFQRA